MLSFERRVVAALTRGVDPRRRHEIETWVSESLADMPHHLRLGVGMESLALGLWSRVSRSDPEAVLGWLEQSDIAFLRQYDRLFRSLVLFARLELEPAAAT